MRLKRIIIVIFASVITVSFYKTNIFPTANAMTNSEIYKTSVKCEKAVNRYLKIVKKKKGNVNQKVTTGSNIIVDYIWRLSDGTIFDTSIKSIARACGTYQKDRDYKIGLSFTAWDGQMIVGFDRGIMNMVLGTTKTVTIPAEQAYGTKYISLPINLLPAKADNTSYIIGDIINTIQGELKIESINDKEFTILNTHPLADKDLIFDITIKEIN